jgi:hypothetical protein
VITYIYWTWRKAPRWQFWRKSIKAAHTQTVPVLEVQTDACDVEWYCVPRADLRGGIDFILPSDGVLISPLPADIPRTRSLGYRYRA